MKRRQGPSGRRLRLSHRHVSLLWAISALLWAASCGTEPPADRSPASRRTKTTPPASRDQQKPTGRTRTKVQHAVVAPKPDPASPERHATETTPENPTDDQPQDEKYEERMVGVWRQEETGTRWLRLRPDGTGVMHLDPNWIAQALIGDSLTMQIRWRVDNGRAIMNSVSGQPQDAFETIKTLYGTRRDQPIVTLNDHKFVLLEKDDELSIWKRVTPGTTLPEAIE